MTARRARWRQWCPPRSGSPAPTSWLAGRKGSCPFLRGGAQTGGGWQGFCRSSASQSMLTNTTTAHYTRKVAAVRSEFRLGRVIKRLAPFLGALLLEFSASSRVHLARGRGQFHTFV